MCRFRQEQEAILRAKEEERRAQLAEKAKARETYKEKMTNAMKLDVSCVFVIFITFMKKADFFVTYFLE